MLGSGSSGPACDPGQVASSLSVHVHVCVVTGHPPQHLPTPQGCFGDHMPKPMGLSFVNGVLVRCFMMWIKHRGRTPQFLLCISSRYDLCPLGPQLPHLSNGGRPGFRKIQLSL